MKSERRAMVRGSSADPPQIGTGDDDNGSHPSSRRRGRSAASGIGPTLRLAVWLIALPLGCTIAILPAWELGYLKKTDLLDVFIGTGWARFEPVVVITLAWALITALVVHFSIATANRAKSRKAVVLSRDVTQSSSRRIRDRRQDPRASSKS